MTRRGALDYGGFEEYDQPISTELLHQLGRWAIETLPAQVVAKQKGDDADLAKGKVVLDPEQQVDAVFEESELLSEEYLSALERGQDFIASVTQGLPPQSMAHEAFLEDRPAYEVAAVISDWVAHYSVAFNVLTENTEICVQYRESIVSSDKLAYLGDVNKAERSLLERLRRSFWRDYMG